MGNYPYPRKKNPTDSSGNYLRTETRRMNLKKSLPNLQSKENEPTPSSIGVESSWVWTEVDYNTKFDPKPTPETWNNMGNTETRCFWKNRGQKMLKVDNEKMEGHIIRLKEELFTMEKKEKYSTIDINMINMVLLFLMFETVR